MSGHSIVYRLMTVGLIISIIIAPVFNNEPLDKASVIAFLICILPWVIAGIIVDIRDSSEFEAKIKVLEDRVKELEDKKK